MATTRSGGRSGSRQWMVLMTCWLEIGWIILRSSLAVRVWGSWREAQILVWLNGFRWGGLGKGFGGESWFSN